MCGIFGALLLEQGSVDVDAALRTIGHRGPDATGVWRSADVLLGHTRLAIIDLTPAGAQPMASPDANVVLVFNGEIYNHHQLRAELVALGHRFRSRSDTEVILEGYRAWGDGVVERLDGMFAIGIWDVARKRLLLARDRMGKKPLYFHRDQSSFRFASEAKAITASGIAAEMDPSALPSMLAFGYTPAPRSMLRGIEQLAPATLLTLEWGRAPVLRRYWKAPFAAPPLERSAPEAIAEIRTLLEAAVSRRLEADVPLGAFLSGGIDSTVIVGIMTRLLGRRVKTFSIGFPAKEYDETRYARMVAERYGTEHEEFIVEPDAVAILPKLVWHYGEPFADPSAIPTYCVSQMARRHVTVALNGDGGDEAFLGYARYRAMHHLDRLDRLPGGRGRGRSAVARLLGMAPASIGRKLRLPQIREMLDAPTDEPERRYAGAIAFFGDPDKMAGYGEAMRGQLAHSALDLLAPYFAGAENLVAGANRADFHTYLPDDLMVKVDVASMAHGLETRSPLLDHVLLEWALSIPAEVRMAGGRTKALLKSAMAPYLPRELIHRKKMGFGCPIDEWLRNELKPLAYDTLLGQSARERGLLRPDYVRRLLDEHCSGARNHHTRLWALLMLELWFKMWIDGSGEQETLRPAA